MKKQIVKVVSLKNKCVWCGKETLESATRVECKGFLRGTRPICSKKCLKKTIDFGFKIIKQPRRKRKNATGNSSRE